MESLESVDREITSPEMMKNRSTPAAPTTTGGDELKALAE
jgi:hypothetical protein